MASTDYNKQLSKRRLHSVQNYFINYKNGVLKPFIENNKLHFTLIPFGEFKANPSTSNISMNHSKSIYSPDASLERFVQISGVSLIEIDKNKKIAIQRNIHDAGIIKNGEKIVSQFIVINNTEEVITFKNLEGSHPYKIILNPDEIIKPGASSSIKVEINTRETRGKKVFHHIILLSDGSKLELYTLADII